MKLCVVFLVAIAGVALAGCSDNASEGDSTGSGGSAGAGPTPTSASSSSSSTTTTNTGGSGGTNMGAGGDGGGAGGGECQQLPDFDTCGTCCIDNDPAGFDLLQAHWIRACGCDEASPCHETCGMEPICVAAPSLEYSEACSQCETDVPSDAQCINAGVMTCIRDVDCEPLIDCVFACPR
jgi:hypothetical protein